MAYTLAAQPTNIDLAHTSTAPEQTQCVTVEDFAELFLQFQPRIISYIAGKLGNREQAYDLAQDTFTKAYRALQQGKKVPTGAFSAWIYRIAGNTTTDVLRRRQVILWVPLSAFTDDRSIGAGIPNEGRNRNDSDGGMGSAFFYKGGCFENGVADRDIVERILWKRMEAKYSVCLWMYEHDGLSCSEIARAVQISVSAVKMRLMRGRQRFADLYRSEVEQD